MAKRQEIPKPYDQFEPDISKKKLKDTQSVNNNINVKQTIEKYWIRQQNAEMAVKDYHEQWKLIDKFDRGEQWSNASNIPPWVPKPRTNYIRYTRTMKRASLGAAIPRPELVPQHEDDEEMVGMLQLAHDHVWDTHRVDRHVRRNIDVSLNQGTSIMYVYHDDAFYGGKYYGSQYDQQDPNFGRKQKDKKNELFQGDIKVKVWPNENFFPDPDAYYIEEAKWINTSEIVQLRDLKNNPAFIKYCKAQGTLDKLMNLNYTQLVYEDNASGDIYERSYTPLNTPRNIKGDEVVTMFCTWEKYFKGGREHLDVTYWLWHTDFFLLRLEDVKPAEYPFAILYDEEDHKSFWGSSTAHDILELQKLLNKTEQVAAVQAALHQNPQKIISRQSGINGQEVARTGTLPGHVYQTNTDPKNSIYYLEPPEIPQGLFEVQDRTVQKIRDITGITEAYAGESVGSLTTSTGVQDLLGRATIRDRDKMIQIDEFVERISSLIIQFILYKWKDRRTIARVDKLGKIQYGKWEPVDEMTAENLSWRVKSDIYPHSPMTQQARRQQANQMLQWQGQYNFQPPVITVEEWIKAQELPNESDILQRMSEDRMQMQAKEASDLQAQIVQVAQQISAAKSQGLPDQQVQQEALQAAQQLLQKQEEYKEMQGMQQKNEPEGPNRGVASPASMHAMTSGQMGG